MTARGQGHNDREPELKNQLTGRETEGTHPRAESERHRSRESDRQARRDKKAPAAGLHEQLPSLFLRLFGFKILESEKRVGLYWSDSKGTRVSPKGPCGVTSSICPFPNTELLPGAPKPGPRPEVSCSGSECLPIFHRVVSRQKPTCHTSGAKGRRREADRRDDTEKRRAPKTAFPL